MSGYSGGLAERTRHLCLGCGHGQCQYISLHFAAFYVASECQYWGIEISTSLVYVGYFQQRILHILQKVSTLDPGLRLM